MQTASKIVQKYSSQFPWYHSEPFTLFLLLPNLKSKTADILFNVMIKQWIAEKPFICEVATSEGLMGLLDKQIKELIDCQKF